MLLHVPVSLDGLLSLLSPCFTQPSFQTFRALVIGQVAQTGRRTVCGMLVGARLSGVWEHSRAHRFFSRARWQPDMLGLALAVLIVERFLDPAAAVTVAQGAWLLLPSRRDRQQREVSRRVGEQLGGRRDLRQAADARADRVPAGPV
jgi:hypothetical protein